MGRWISGYEVEGEEGCVDRGEEGGMCLEERKRRKRREVEERVKRRGERALAKEP